MSIHKEVKRVKGQQLISFQPRAKKNKLDTQTASSSIADVISNVSLPSEKIDKSSQSVPTESDLFSVVTENAKKLDLILNKFNELTLSSDNGLQPFVKDSLSQVDDEISEMNDVKLHQCKTVNDICTQFDEMSYKPEQNMLICTFCVVYSVQSDFSIVPGCFNYDVIHDDEYTTTNSMSREFRNMKKSIKRHLASFQGMNTILVRHVSLMKTMP